MSFDSCCGNREEHDQTRKPGWLARFQVRRVEMRLHDSPARLAARSGWSGCGQFRFPELRLPRVSQSQTERGNGRWPQCKHPANHTSTKKALKNHKLLKVLSITASSLPFARFPESHRRNLLHKGGGSFDWFARRPDFRSGKAVLTIRGDLPSLSAL